jgi:hypothetical protein
MSPAGWYLNKAEQCARMARNATDLQRRGAYEEEQKLWLQIVERIELNERNQFGSDPL